MKETSEKRSAILNATLTLISQYGFHSTSMSMIVKKSGVSTGVIYHYFVSKEEIIMELYRTIKIDAIRYMLKNYREDDAIYDSFKKIWLGSYEYCRFQPEKTSFLEQFEYSPYLTPTMSEEFYSELKPISDLLAKSLNEGIVKKLPIDLLVGLFNEGALLLGKKYRDISVKPDEALVELMIKSSWDAIKK